MPDIIRKERFAVNVQKFALFARMPTRTHTRLQSHLFEAQDANTWQHLSRYACQIWFGR
jgi:hypothetical protein